MIERIGCIGGGQLGQMITQAALPLGFKVEVIDPVEFCPAAQAGASQIQAELNDSQAIVRLGESNDVVTWEIEHIPTTVLGELVANGIDVEPNFETLLCIQDKLTQKKLLQSAGVPVAPFSEVLNEDAFLGGGPYVVKTRKGGFDGRGNFMVDHINPQLIADHFFDQPVYVEQVVAFEKEIAVIAARDKVGNIVSYPAVETVHNNSICNMVISPAEVPEDIIDEANQIANTVMGLFHGAGVFAIEMFVVNGKVLVNEVAPRVHNSGHHTIEANQTSQFEQHIRAISGMPLGDTSPRSPAAVMINILGNRSEVLSREGLNRVLAMPDTHPHFYGKSSRPARKIGHITVLAETADQAKLMAVQARQELYI
jgi:5-(carboxyamino)imidazole ribonucleotide synthase